MNPNRYTYMHGRPTKPAQSADRSAYNASHNSVNKPSLSKQAMGEKVTEMAGRILQQVNKLHNSTALRAITKDMLKEGGSKIFFDVFAILARALDDRVERDQVTLEGVLSLLKVLGYPGFVGKNIFQPIGAPHTWLHCLAILDFMAEVARYSSSFKTYCQEMDPRELQKDQNYLIMQAVFSGDSTKLETRYRSELVVLREKVQKVSGQSQRCEATIRNMNLQQRSLSQVSAAIEVEAAKVKQLQAEVAAKKTERKLLLDKIANKKKDLDRAEERQMGLNRQAAALEYQLTHNELTPQENDRLKEELMIKKAEDRVLEETLARTNLRIRAGCETAVSEVRMAYDLAHFSAVEAAKHSQRPVDIPHKDNSKELFLLAESLLFSDEPRECNVTQQIQKISAQWQLPDIKYQLQKIEEQIQGRLREKQRRNAELVLRAQQVGEQHRNLVACRDQLRDRRDRLGALALEQQNQLKKLRDVNQQWAQRTEQLRVQISRKRELRVKTEEDISRLMVEIEAIRDNSNSFVAAMGRHFKAADEALLKAKEQMLCALGGYDAELQQVLASSKAVGLLEEVVEGIRLKQKQQQKKSK